jgi:hypothetical protein
MSRELLKKILLLEKAHSRLLSELIEDREMVRGSFCEIHVKCGKNCRCNSGQGHKHKRMSLHENGKKFSRAVPREDYEWIQRMTDNFREYRSKRRQLARIEDEIRELLDQQETKIVDRCKKGKLYLNVSDSEAKREKPSEKA